MFTNTNSYSLPQYSSRPQFASLKTSSSDPSSGMLVLNQNDTPYKAVMTGLKKGKLNPNQDNINVIGRNYYTIDYAYGSEPTQIYESRSCSGGSGSDLSGAGVDYLIGGQKGTDDVNDSGTSGVNSLSGVTPSGYMGSPKLKAPKSKSKIQQFFSGSSPVVSNSSSYGSVDNPMIAKNIKKTSFIIGSGQILIRGQDLTSIGGARFLITEEGKICITRPNQTTSECYFPQSGSGRSTTALDKIVMHPTGEFEMIDVNSRNIPLIYTGDSRPLKNPIPGSYAIFNDNTSFSIFSPNADFLYNIF